MPKKEKKPLNKKPLKKPKLKNAVNVKINIDNSKKSAGRRVASASTKSLSHQPFSNFPSYQPTRVQQLEPKQQFNNADLTKTITEIYQKQFQVYNDTQDKDYKKTMEEVHASLKKDLAPSQKDSAPGAYNAYGDNAGQTVFEELVNPVSEKSVKPVSEKSVKPVTWANPNELKGNALVETEVEPLPANQLFEDATATATATATPLNIEEARPLTTKEVVGGLNKEVIKEVTSEIKNKELEENRQRYYNEYVVAYKQYYGDEDRNYIKINALNPDGKERNSPAWSKIRNGINKKIEKYGTRKQELKHLSLDTVKKRLPEGNTDET